MKKPCARFFGLEKPSGPGAFFWSPQNSWVARGVVLRGTCLCHLKKINAFQASFANLSWDDPFIQRRPCMNIDLTGKVALISGASRGIGRGLMPTSQQG